MGEEIKTDGIHVGQEFPNYKALCRALGIPAVSGGSGRKKQNKAIRRHIDFERISSNTQRIVVTTVHSVPNPTSSNSKHQQHVVPLIQHQVDLIGEMLRRGIEAEPPISAPEIMEPQLNDDVKRDIPISIWEVWFTRQQFMSELGMINLHFFDAFNELVAWEHYTLPANSKILNCTIPVNEALNLFRHYYDRCKNIIERALNKLQRAGEIKWESTYKLLVSQEGDNGIWLSRLVSQEEEEHLHYMKTALLMSMDCADHKDLYKKGKLREFNQKFNMEARHYFNTSPLWVMNIGSVKAVQTVYRVMYSVEVASIDLSTEQAQKHRDELNLNLRSSIYRTIPKFAEKAKGNKKENEESLLKLFDYCVNTKHNTSNKSALNNKYPLQLFLDVENDPSENNDFPF